MENIHFTDDTEEQLYGSQSNTKSSITDLLNFSSLSLNSTTPTMVPWKSLARGRPENTLKLISYNVLAQTHLEHNKYLYKYNNPDHLKWSHRSNLLKKFFTRNLSDIYCLQEVEANHLKVYEKYFQNEHPVKLACHFDKKPCTKPDGCLIVYNEKKFEAIHKSRVDMSINVPFRQQSPNVGQVILFREKATNLPLVVANTHLIFNRNNGHIKLFQISSLIQEISNVCEKIQNGQFQAFKKSNVNLQNHVNNKLATILCGDFNSTADSALCHFLKSKQLDITKISRRQVSNQKLDTPTTIKPLLNEISKTDIYPLKNGTIFEHLLNLNSAYTIEECLNGYTQTDSDGLVVDHIFYNNLKIYSRLGLLEKKAMRLDILPGKKYGSDHMPVGIEFLLE